MPAAVVPAAVAVAVAPQDAPEAMALTPAPGKVASDSADPSDSAAVGDVAQAPTDSASIEAPAEPDMIEVWRPKRRNEAGARRPRRGRHGRDAQSPGVAAVPNATPNGSGPPNAGRRDGPGHGPKHGPPGQRQGQRAGGAPGKSAGARGGKPRFDKSAGGRRDDKRSGPKVHTSAPARRKGADPDSPFAALSALKDALSKPRGDS